MMEDKCVAAGDFPRASPSSAEISDRQVFHVDLRPGETTIVSWKKLLRDANKAGGSISSDPEPLAMANSTLGSRITTVEPSENEVKDASAPHRFSAVIQKIERLYMGKHSSDEEDMNDFPDDDQYDTEDSFIDDAELDEYFEVDNSEIKHDGFFINRGQLEHIKRRKKDLPKACEENGNVHVLNKHAKLNKVASGKEASQKNNAYNPPQTLASKNEQPPDLKSLDQLNAEASITLDESSLATVSNGDNSASHAVPKKLKKQKMGALPSKNFGNKWEHANEPFEISHQKYLNKKDPVQPKSRFAIPLPDKSAFKYPQQTTKTLHMHKRDGSSAKPKGALLERAIRELERMVAESRPPSVENQETDSSSQMIKRRLPTEIKLKLARVARLAASHGKLTSELVNRLMSILGHFMQLRTLKRNLKAMISTGVSAKQEKDDRFHQIKKEITEMVKMQITSLEPKASDKQAGRSDDLKVGSEGKSSMDTALEDKMCDLHDLFVDGLDEDAGPQIRKLYTELAELWPSGIMNSHGIRRSICRAKERRRTLYNKQKDEKIKKMPPPISKDTLVQPLHVQEKLCADSDACSSVSTVKPVSTLSNGPGTDKPKLKGTSGDSPADARVSASDSTKKKVKKRKHGVQSDESHVCGERNGTSPTGT